MNLSKKLAILIFLGVFISTVWVTFLILPLIDTFLNIRSQNLLALFFFAILKIILLTILIVVPTSAVLWFLVNKFAIKPVKYFSEITKIISAGNLGKQVEYQERDELGELGQNINAMVRNLSTAFQSMATSLRNEKLKEKELQVVNEKLKELDKVKDEFVSIASHELRTPMTAIKGLISMIFEGDYGHFSVELKDPLSDIAVSTDRLISLVNDMLDTSRIEAGRLKFMLGEYSVADLVSEIIVLLKSLTNEKGILLEAQPSAERIYTDPNKFKQILSNLVGNSIKFTDHGKISVSFKVNGEHLFICITDTGLGISKEDQGKLFGKFTQISSTQLGRPKGTGLGLYISREFARKLGGDLWIEYSEIGKGSTFVFSAALSGTEAAKKVEEDLHQFVDTEKPL